MRRYNQEVFEEVIRSDVASYYTSSRHDRRLGQFDRLVVQAVIDHVDPSDADGTLTVFVETSGDGEHWDDKNHTAAIMTAAATRGATTTTCATDGATPLALAMVRLRLVLTTTAQARVRVYVTARDIGR